MGGLRRLRYLWRCSCLLSLVTIITVVGVGAGASVGMGIGMGISVWLCVGVVNVVNSDVGDIVDIAFLIWVVGLKVGVIVVPFKSYFK